MPWSYAFNHGSPSFSQPVFHGSYHEGSAGFDHGHTSQPPLYGPPSQMAQFESSMEASVLYTNADPGSKFSHSFSATDVDPSTVDSSQPVGQHILPNIVHGDTRPPSPFLPVTTLAQRFSQPWQCQKPVHSHETMRTSTLTVQPSNRHTGIYTPSFLGQAYQQDAPQRWIRDSSRPPAVPLHQQLATSSRQTRGTNLALNESFRGSGSPHMTPKPTSNVMPIAVQQSSSQERPISHSVPTSNSYTELLNAAIPPRRLPFSRQPKTVEYVHEPREDQAKRDAVSSGLAQNKSKKRKLASSEGDEQDLALDGASQKPTKSTIRGFVVSEENVKPDAAKNIKKRAATMTRRTEGKRLAKKVNRVNGVEKDGPHADGKVATTETGMIKIKTGRHHDLTTDIIEDPLSAGDSSIHSHEAVHKELNERFEQTIATSEPGFAEQRSSATSKGAARPEAPARSRTATKPKAPAKPKATATRKTPIRSKPGAEPAVNTESKAIMKCKRNMTGGVLAKRKTQVNSAAPVNPKTPRTSQVKPQSAVSSSRSRRKTVCDQCRAHRRKCEGGQPVCSRCVTQGLDCSWTQLGTNASTIATQSTFQPAKVEKTLADPYSTNVTPRSRAQNTILGERKPKTKRAKKQTSKRKQRSSSKKIVEPKETSTADESSSQPKPTDPSDKSLTLVTNMPDSQAATTESTTPALLKILSDVEDVVAAYPSEHQPSLLDALLSLKKVEDILATRLTRDDLIRLADPAMFVNPMTPRN